MYVLFDTFNRFSLTNQLKSLTQNYILYDSNFENFTKPDNIIVFV